MIANNFNYIFMILLILQECRKHKYADNTQDHRADKHMKKMATTPDDLEEVCEYLIHLMSSDSSLDMDSKGLHCGNKRLLEEIELFFRTLTWEDDS